MKIVLLEEEEAGKILREELGSSEPVFTTDLAELVERVFGVENPSFKQITSAERLWMYGDDENGFIVQDYGNGWYFIAGLYTTRPPEEILEKYGIRRYEVFENLEAFLKYLEKLYSEE